METNIVLPSLGESVSEGTISKWYKKVGDIVQVDEKIAEVESDKVAIEINATVSGRISKILKNEGDNVAVGAAICIVSAAEATQQQHSQAPINATSGQEDMRQKQNLQLSPAVAKIVAENDLNPQNIVGSGKDGRITKADVLDTLSALKQNTDNMLNTPSTSYNAPASSVERLHESPNMSVNQSQQVQKQVVQPITNSDNHTLSVNNRLISRVPMTKLRRTIAQRLKDAQNTAAMLSTFNEVDMSHVMETRKKYRDEFEKKHNVKLGFMSFFIKAVVAALQEQPMVNAQIDGNDIIYHNYCDIGVAVSTNSGLVVPVVRNAERLSFAEIETAIANFGKKARDGRLSISDLSGGTFTVTNGGVFGSLLSTPIINPPQSAIMGMHKIQERPVVLNGTIQIRPMMYIVLSYDHRIIDGKEAVTFLTSIKSKIEDPERLLLEI